MTCNSHHMTSHPIGDCESLDDGVIYESLWCGRDEGHTGWHGSWSFVERATIVWTRPGVTSMP